MALEAARPDAVLSIGDTDTTLGASEAAFQMGLPFVHVEHGAPGFSKEQPESQNRRRIEELTDLGLKPLEFWRNRAAKAIWSGDLLLDAYFNRAPRSQKQETDQVLATLHRAELFASPSRLDTVLAQLGGLGIMVRLPAHPARVRVLAERVSALQANSIVLEPPMSHADFLVALSRASLCVTDSGGVVREALFSGTSVVHVGAYSAWANVDRPGAPVLWNPEAEALEDAFGRCARIDIEAVHKIFGGGCAARRIVEALVERY